MLYIKINQHFKRNTMGNTQRELVFLNLKIFIFWKCIFHFFYHLNNSYLYKKIVQNFKRYTLGNYQRGLVFLKLKIFLFW